MEISVQMGYVTRRRGARLHVDAGGHAYCHAGGSTIIATSKLTDASAGVVCRRCRDALRTRLSLRSDELARRNFARARAEGSAITALLDAMEELEPQTVKDDLSRMIEEIRENMALATSGTSTAMITSGSGQISLF